MEETEASMARAQIGRVKRRLGQFGCLAVVALAVPAAAQAAPPPNDNYLASATINSPSGALPREFHPDPVDTSEATTQADTFDPNREGLPFGGGKPEPTSCGTGAAYGKTVWFDFVPPTAGGVQIVAAGFDAVVAVYRWNPQNSQLGSLVACQNASTGPTEEVLLQQELRARRNYTVQVGGVGGAGGVLDFQFTFFPDRDADGILDEQPDKCPRLAGIPAFGGCPPVVRGAPGIFLDSVAGGFRLSRVVVDRVERGARVEVRCGGCGPPVRARARRAGTLRLTAPGRPRPQRGRSGGASPEPAQAEVRSISLRGDRQDDQLAGDRLGSRTQA
jgi:hypothetical protein